MVIRNCDKCQFRLPKLTFFRHELSKNGIAPSEEMIAAVVNASTKEHFGSSIKTTAKPELQLSGSRRFKRSFTVTTWGKSGEQFPTLRKI